MEQTLVARRAPAKPPAPSEEIAQLRAILRMVDELAGSATAAAAEIDDATLDARHAAAPSLVRARYARLASQTAAFAAAGVARLIEPRADGEDGRRAAAAYLAGEMRYAIGNMAHLLR